MSRKREQSLPTPGKWECWPASRMMEVFGGTKEDYPEPYYIIAEDPEHPEMPWVLATLHSGVPNDELANGRLVAAAPAMLAALRSAHASLAPRTIPYGERAVECAALRKMWLAIEAATEDPE